MPTNTRLRRVPILLFLLIPGILSFAAAAQEPSDKRYVVPAAFHLSSFGSTLAARVDKSGAIDSGAGVLQFTVGDERRPLDSARIRYGRGPALWLTWWEVVDGLVVSVRALASPVARDGDIRLQVAARVLVENPGDHDVTLPLGARIAAGGGTEPLRRPYQALAIGPDTLFSTEDGRVLRDGRLLARSTGPAPRIELVAAVPATADEDVARLSWELTVPSQESRLIEVFLAGPPTTATVADEAWRDAFERWSYDALQERLDWQSEKAGAFAGLQTIDSRLTDVLVASVHHLRALGQAHSEVKSLSDRPYGHPASDAAIEAEMLACMHEWGLTGFAVPYLRTLLDEARERAADLAPDRRVAYVHGLARCVRLARDPAWTAELAPLVRELVTEPAQVRPWSDPEIVRADLQAILDEAGLAEGFELPLLSVMTVAPLTSADHMRLCRAALSRRDVPAARAAFRALLVSTSVDGIGSMLLTGEPDGRYAIGLLTLARELFVDDHGEALRLLPGIAAEDIPQDGSLDTTFLPSTWGVFRTQLYWTSARGTGLGAWVQAFAGSLPDEHTLVVPHGIQVRKAPKAIGGRYSLANDEGTELKVFVDPTQTIGARVNLKLSEDGYKPPRAPQDIAAEDEDAAMLPPERESPSRAVNPGGEEVEPGEDVDAPR